MKTTEFMFRFPGCGNETARYSVIVVHGVSVTFIRIGAADRPFSLMVPRVHDETFAHARAEDLARLAIAQAIYAELFEAHPQGAVDLEVHGPLWDGDLETGQWRHGMAQAAPEAPVPTWQQREAPLAARASIATQPTLDANAEGNAVPSIVTP
jgi:hypothetical protein